MNQPTAELPSAYITAVADVFAHCALSLPLDGQRLAPDALRLLGAHSTLLALPVRWIRTVELQRMLTGMGIAVDVLLPLIEEHQSPYKGEAWDNHWAHVVAQLRQLAGAQ